jgi:hypothetical protein
MEKTKLKAAAEQPKNIPLFSQHFTALLAK